MKPTLTGRIDPFKSRLRTPDEVKRMEAEQKQKRKQSGHFVRRCFWCGGKFEIRRTTLQSWPLDVPRFSVLEEIRDYIIMQCKTCGDVKINGIAFHVKE
jgi:hypothetical protein